MRYYAVWKYAPTKSLVRLPVDCLFELQDLSVHAGSQRLYLQDEVMTLPVSLQILREIDMTRESYSAVMHGCTSVQVMLRHVVRGLRGGRSLAKNCAVMTTA